MRGMDRLMQLRRDGLRPEVLTLWVPGIGGRHAFEGTVLAEPNDHPTLADLRALKGLAVLVMGRCYGGFDEALAWVWAAAAAGAATVGVAFPIPLADGGGMDGPIWVRRNGHDVLTARDLA